MSKDKISADSIKYWDGMRLGDGHSCPNVSFFRFLGYGGIGLDGKKVLEIGFGANRGEDLLECQARGALVYGVDINEPYIEDFKKKHPKIPVSVMNAGLDKFPFGLSFDMIFHKDVVYYLSDDQISFHFKNSYQNLNPGGHLVFQFIENDLTVNADDLRKNSYELDFDALKNADTSKMFRGEVNPVRKMNADWLISQAESCGFKLHSTKTVIESYTPDESVYRVDRYLLLEK